MSSTSSYSNEEPQSINDYDKLSETCLIDPPFWGAA